MALVKADRVKETSNSIGLTNFILSGASIGFRSFASVCTSGDTFYYAIANQANSEWEVGLGTFGSTGTLDRTTVHASSNANAKVNFSAGTKDCFISVTKTWLDTFITQTSGTTNYVAKTTGTGTIGNSQIFDNGTNVGIGTTSPSGKLHVSATGVAEAKLEGTTSTYLSFFKSGTTYGFVGLGSSLNNDLYLSTYGSGSVVINYATAVAASNTIKALVVKGFAGQSANLQDWQNSGGTILQAIDANGRFTKTIVIAANGVDPQLLIYKSPDGVLRSSQQVVYLGTGTSAPNIGTGNGNEKGYLALYDGGTIRSQLYAYSGGGGINNYVLDGMSFGQISAAAGQVVVAPTSASTKGVVVKGAFGQSASLQEWQNSGGTALSAVKSDGSIQPASLADSAATNNSIYYSTTAGKLVYKDSSGTVNNLY